MFTSDKGAKKAGTLEGPEFDRAITENSQVLKMFAGGRSPSDLSSTSPNKQENRGGMMKRMFTWLKVKRGGDGECGAKEESELQGDMPSVSFATEHKVFMENDEEAKKERVKQLWRVSHES